MNIYGFWILPGKELPEPPRLEERVTTSFKEISEKLTEEEKNARIDIRYKKITGKHVIIELKRSSVQVKEGQLADQVSKYINALEKQLNQSGEEGLVECICLLGELPIGWIRVIKENREKTCFPLKIFR